MNKAISPLMQQTCLRKLGAYVSERMSIDLYYLVEVIYHLIPLYGEESLIKEYPDYLKVKKKLKKLNQIVSKSKTFYDVMSDKAFKKKFSDLDKFEKYLNKQLTKVSSQVPVIQLDIYKLFYYLVSNCAIQSQTVRGDMLKILEYRENTPIHPNKNPSPGNQR